MSTAAATTTVTTPDGRDLDIYLAGPPDGEVVVFNSATPSMPLPDQPMIDLMAERGLRHVAFSRSPMARGWPPTSRPRSRTCSTSMVISRSSSTP